MATLQKTELNASIGHIAMFVKLGISIFDSKSQMRLAEKREEGEEEEFMKTQ